MREGESGRNVLSARWLYYKLNRSAQLRGWCTKGIGVTTPRSIIRNDGAFPTIHGYLVFTGYKRTNTFVRTRTPNDPLTSASFTRKRRSRWERSGVRGDTQGWVGVQKKLNDTRPCLLALLTTRCSVQCARLTFDRMDDEDRVEQSFAKKFVSHDLVYYHARWRYF